MEHRWRTRIPLSTRVTLYRNNKPIAKCMTKDIGIGGVFLESGSLSYVKNTILTVQLTLETEEGPEQFRLLVCIRHSTDTGVGLMFLADENNFSHHIRQLVLNGVTDNDQSRNIANYHSVAKHY